MFHQSSKQILFGIFVASLLMTMPVYAVETYKISDYGGGHQIWFEAEDFDERNPDTDQYFPVVDEAGAFGQAITRAGGAGGMIRWTFNIGAAGGKGGTWYFWGRVINPSNQSDFMLVEGHPGEPQIPTDPPFPGTSSAAGFTNEHRVFEEDMGPPWEWGRSGHGEAHTKELQGGENTMYILHRQGNDTVFWDVFMWTDSPDYVPTDEDYQNAFPGLGFGPASRPDPANGALYTDTWASLGWRPGDFAVSHDVYLGDNFDDVNDGTPDSSGFQGNQPLTSTFFVTGLPGYPYPDGLVPGTTYYWRIDEVNDLDPNSPWKGDVWSFTIPPRNAYIPTPADGAVFIDPNVELSWDPGFGVKLHYVYFGNNFDDVNNAVVGLPQAATTYIPGTLELDKDYYWRVDEFDGIATHKGDVWSFKTLPDIPITDPNLVGWWKLDEGMGTIALDWSGYGHHGTFEGDPQWVDGYDGGALEFDGDDHVDTGYTENLVNWTITCWVISPASPSGDSPSGPLHREQNYQFNWNHGDETYRGAAAMNVGGTWHAAKYIPLAANTWYHLAATYDGSVLKAYRDGVLITSNSAPSGPPNAESGTLKLGRHATAAQFFTGTVDDARVYNKALTLEEIQQAMRGDTTRAWNPSPANGSTPDIERATPLSWSPGDKASGHDVYFGTDRDAVDNAEASDTTGLYRGQQVGTSYTPPEGVEWGGGPYYWRIDELNTDATVNRGGIWSFTVVDHILVDDFEDYDIGNNEIWWAWKDGLGYAAHGNEPAYPGNGTGSAVGDENTPSYTEETIVHGGSQSMPLFYNNNLNFSEAELLLSPAQDWTKHGVTVLSLYFHGEPSNAVEQMYVKVNGSKVVYSGDAADISQSRWNAWIIPLEEFANQGVNLQNVTKLSIGFGDELNIRAGGSGVVYFDDIRLYRSAPELPDEIWLEAEAADSITSPMKTYDDPLASGGKYIGTDDGSVGDEQDNAPADGVATYNFTVAGGTYKILVRVKPDQGNSFWFRIVGATNQSHEDPDQPGTGWVRWNDIEAGADWHWDEVHSNDHSNAIVNWTLPAGTHTLEIARREDGGLLDAILITDDVD